MTNEEKAEQFDLVMDGLLDAVVQFEGKASAGVVAYGLLTLGCQLAHDYCPEGQDWQDLVNVVVSQTRRSPDVCLDGLEPGDDDEEEELRYSRH